MIQKISRIQPLPGFRLFVLFDDGKRVVYNVDEDMNLPGYDALRTVHGLFQQVQMDESRTCVYWNDEIDLPSDTIYEYGQTISDEIATPNDLEAVQAARAEYVHEETVPQDVSNWD